jgi:hypothetical protein
VLRLVSYRVMRSRSRLYEIDELQEHYPRATIYLQIWARKSRRAGTGRSPHTRIVAILPDPHVRE